MINIGLREIKKNLTNKVILLLFLSAKIVYDLNNVFYFLWSKVIPLIFAKFSLRGKIKFQLISIWRMTPTTVKTTSSTEKRKEKKKEIRKWGPLMSEHIDIRASACFWAAAAALIYFSCCNIMREEREGVIFGAALLNVTMMFILLPCPCCPLWNTVRTSCYTTIPSHLGISHQLCHMNYARRIDDHDPSLLRFKREKYIYYSLLIDMNTWC